MPTHKINASYRPLVFISSIFSGMSSFGDPYHKALISTLERQLAANLDVSAWCSDFVNEEGRWIHQLM